MFNLRIKADVYLLIEKMVSQVIEDHRVGGVDGVSFREKLHTVLD